MAINRRTFFSTITAAFATTATVGSHPSKPLVGRGREVQPIYGSKLYALQATEKLDPSEFVVPDGQGFIRGMRAGKEKKIMGMVVSQNRNLIAIVQVYPK